MSSSAESVTIEKVSLKPDWLQDQRSEGESSSRSLILEMLIGLLLGISLLFLKGELQWFAGIFLLIWIGLAVFSQVRRNTEGVLRWKEEKKEESSKDTPLEKKSKMMKRAVNDREITQAMIEERLRNVFLQKIKEEKNISDEEMGELLEKPSDLKKVLEDRFLTYFLLNGKRYKETLQKNSNSKNLFDGKIDGPNREDIPYARWLDKILEKIKHWP